MIFLAASVNVRKYWCVIWHCFRGSEQQNDLLGHQSGWVRWRLKSNGEEKRGMQDQREEQGKREPLS